MATAEKLGNWTDDPCFYVSIRDAGKFALVAGPFQTHESALAAVKAARKIGCEVDPWAWFYGWGTCKTEHGYTSGRLNEKLAVDHPEIHCGKWDA